MNVLCQINRLESVRQRAFMSSYAAGRSVVVEIRGIEPSQAAVGIDGETAKIMQSPKWMQKALSQLRLPVKVPGLSDSERLVKCAYFSIVVSRMLEFPTVPAFFDIYNPFDVNLNITSVIEVKIFWQRMEHGNKSATVVSSSSRTKHELSSYIGYVNESSLAWSVGQGETERFHVDFHFGASWRIWLQLVQQLRAGTLIVSMQGIVRTRLDSFPVLMDLEYNNIPVYLA